jgi:hypothetical protein
MSSNAEKGRVTHDRECFGGYQNAAFGFVVSGPPRRAQPLSGNNTRADGGRRDGHTGSMHERMFQHTDRWERPAGLRRRPSRTQVDKGEGPRPQ